MSCLVQGTPCIAPMARARCLDSVFVHLWTSWQFYFSNTYCIAANCSYHSGVLEHIPPTRWGFCIPYELSSNLSSSQPWVTTVSLFAFVNLTTLDGVYQWHGAAFVFLCLACTRWLWWKEHSSAGASSTHPSISFGDALHSGIAGAC